MLADGKIAIVHPFASAAISVVVTDCIISPDLHSTFALKSVSIFS